MSARQNKKQRKGRNSANNRERTVTTLTENPNTPYLVPTPSEDPPGHLSAQLGTKLMGSQPYQMSANFGGFQGFAGTFNPPQPYFPPPQSQTMQQQPPQTGQQYQQPTSPASPGQKDLEILQNLKQLILDNQHPVFRAVPQPATLAKIYKGILPPPPSQPQGGIVPGEAGSGSATADSGRLATRRLSKDSSATQQNVRIFNRFSPVCFLTTSQNPSNSHEGRYEYSTSSRAQTSDSAPMGDRNDHPANGNKRQSMDDPMNRDEAHENKNNISPWTSKQPPVYSESGHPDSDRTPTSHAGVAPLLAMASSQPDTPSTTAVFDAPGGVRDREWSWQDRHRRPDYDRPSHRGRQQTYHRPRRVSSALDNHRPMMVDDPQIRRGGPIVESSQSHVTVDSRGPSTDVMRPSTTSDRPVHESGDSDAAKRAVDYHLHPDARVPSLASRIESIESDVPPTRPNDSVNSGAAPPASSGLTSPDAHVQDPGQRDTAGGGGADPHGPSPRSRPLPHYGFNKKRFQKHLPHSAGQGATYNTHASDHPTPRSAQGRPPSPSLPPSGASRPVHPRSSSVDGRRGRFPSPVGGARGWEPRGPQNGRDISRDRPPPGYRGDYDPDVNPIRYGERPYGRDYSPPPTHGPSFPPGERGTPGTYASPSSGITPGRDWGGYAASYPQGNRRDWSAAEEEAYTKSRTWEGRPPPPPSSERDRYDYPPRSANWVERDYPGRGTFYLHS